MTIAEGSFFSNTPETVHFFLNWRPGFNASVQINPWRAFVEEKNWTAAGFFKKKRGRKLNVWVMIRAKRAHQENRVAKKLAFWKITGIVLNTHSSRVYFSRGFNLRWPILNYLDIYITFDDLKNIKDEIEAEFNHLLYRLQQK